MKSVIWKNQLTCPKLHRVVGRSRRLLGIVAGLGVFVTALAAHADVVTDWNEFAWRLTASMPPPVHGRIVATMHAAIFDAVNAIDHRFATYAVDVKASDGASVDAAAAEAAREVLVRMLPLRQPEIDDALAASLAKIPSGPGKSGGQALGQQVADRIVALRSADGMSAKVTYSFGSGPGAYQPTPPMNQPPVVPQFRFVRPFVLKDAQQIELPGPPPLTGRDYARDVNEIKDVGGRISSKRDAEQTAVAVFWAASEFLPWNAVARAAARQHARAVVENARLFALLNMTMEDALIVAFEGKYRFNAWRPVTAIHEAASMHNADVSADPAWQPLLVTPPHQEYPCAHCITSAAAETVLRSFYGDDKVDAIVVLPDLGVLQHYRSFSEITREVKNARVWGGIHFRSSTEHGEAAGRQIGAYVMATALQAAQR